MVVGIPVAPSGSGVWDSYGSRDPSAVWSLGPQRDIYRLLHRLSLAIDVFYRSNFQYKVYCVSSSKCLCCLFVLEYATNDGSGAVLCAGDGGGFKPTSLSSFDPFGMADAFKVCMYASSLCSVFATLKCSLFPSL